MGTAPFDGQFLSLQVRLCENATSPVVCANFGENKRFLREHLAGHNLYILSTTTFADYDDVLDPYKGPLKKIHSIVDGLALEELELDKTLLKNFSFMEHKVILQDSLMQILTEPEELTILNLDESR